MFKLDGRKQGGKSNQRSLIYFAKASAQAIECTLARGSVMSYQQRLIKHYLSDFSLVETIAWAIHILCVQGPRRG